MSTRPEHLTITVHTGNPAKGCTAKATFSQNFTSENIRVCFIEVDMPSFAEIRVTNRYGQKLFMCEGLQFHLLKSFIQKTVRA